MYLQLILCMCIPPHMHVHTSMFKGTRTDVNHQLQSSGWELAEKELTANRRLMLAAAEGTPPVTLLFREARGYITEWPCLGCSWVFLLLLYFCSKLSIKGGVGNVRLKFYGSKIIVSGILRWIENNPVEADACCMVNFKNKNKSLSDNQKSKSKHRPQELSSPHLAH